MNTLLWILLGLVIVILVCLLPRLIHCVKLIIHQKRLLKVNIPSSFWGIEFGDSFNVFKDMFDYEKITDKNRSLYSYYLLKHEKNNVGFVVKRVNSKAIKFNGIYWDYVVFSFKNGVFESIVFYNDDRYRIQNNIDCVRKQDFVDMFNALVINYDLIKYEVLGGLHARGKFKNNRKVYLNYTTNGQIDISNDFENRHIVEIPGLTISFHDSDI